MSEIVRSGKEYNDMLSRYQEHGTEKDFLFLTVKDLGGAMKLSEELLLPATTAVAVVDLETEELFKGNGVIEWFAKNDHTLPVFGYDFKKYNIYHIRGYIKHDDDPDHFPYRIFLTGLIEDGLSDPRLDKLLAKYLKPVYNDDPELGRFTLNRQYECFEGIVDWLGTKLSVTLELDRSEGKTANKALQHLKTLCADIKGYDEHLRSHISKKYLGEINGWKLRDKPFTEEELCSMIHISELSVNRDGTIKAYYIESGDFFGGHAFEVSASTKGDIYRIDFVG